MAETNPDLPDAPGPQLRNGEPSAKSLEETVAQVAGEPSTVKAFDSAPPRLDPTTDIPISSAMRPGAGTVGNYELLEELGRGGMGVVYKARQRSLHRVVALKMILAGEHASREAHQRFLREAAAVARLRHPHIVQVHELGEFEGRAFFSMEYIQGSDLHNTLISSPRRAAEITEIIARAVHYAHQQGVIHRDLKPANILIDENGSPKVSDFGLAKLDDPELVGQMTVDRQPLGTAAYMPPEQARGDHTAIGPASDVYSLGAILFQALTQQPPFLGKSTWDVLDRVQHQEPWPPSRLARGIPRDLDVICLKCLHKDPARRYPTAEALADDLRAFLQGRPIQARPVGYVERSWRGLRRTPAAQAVLAMLVLLLGLVVWKVREHRLYVRPHVRYYSDHVFTQSGPQGVGPISLQAARARRYSFQIQTQGSLGPVQRITCVDSSGRAVPHESLSSLLDATQDEQPVVAECLYARGAQGELTRILARDRRHRELWSFVFTSPPYAGHYLDAQGYLRTPTGSGAAFLRVAYDSRGYLSKVQFFDQRARPQPNALGSYGYAFLCDELGAPREVRFLDASGKPTQYFGCQKYVQRRNASAQLQEEAYLDTHDQLLLNRLGYARVTYEYDPFGNVRRRLFWDPSSHLVVNSQGFAVQEYQHDDRGRLTAESFLDADRQPTTNAAGVHRVEYQYDAQGLIRREAYFDVQGNPTASTDGFAALARKYNDRGQVIEEAVYDVQGRPTVDVDGSFRTTYSPDEHGNSLETTEYDSQGNLLINRLGWCRQVSVFDPQNRLLERRYLDIHGQPILTSDGTAGLKYGYDDRGNLTSEAYLGTQGDPVCNQDGCARVEYAYNDQGHRTAVAYFDAEGRATYNASGWHRSEMVYDDRGFGVEERFLDTHLQPTWNRDGYSIHKARVDDRGNVTELALYDPAGQAVCGRSGFHRYRAQFDERGNLIDVTFLDTHDKPAVFNGEDFSTLDSAMLQSVTSLGGMTQVSAEYDVLGRITRVHLLEADGRPLWGPLGISSLGFEYDSRGHVLEACFFDIHGRLVTTAPYARMVSQFDNHGHELQREYFDAQNQPVMNQEGYHRMVNTYDQRGNRIDMVLYDPQGQRAAHIQGHSRIVRRYDERGNLLEEQLLDTADRLVVTENEYAIVRAQYDRFGNRIAEAYFDESDRPRVTWRGFHQWRKTYDRQVPVEIAYFDVQGQPVNSHEGFARMTIQYDAQGNEIERRYFDVSASPAEYQGYFRVTIGYTPHGRPCRWEYFDPQGQRVSHTQGYAILTQEYDPLGRVVGSATFDEQERPVLRQPELFHRELLRYNPGGQVIQHQYFGTDDRSIDVPPGYAEWTAQYDERGNLKGKNYYDSNGQPLLVRVIVDELPDDLELPAPSLESGDIVLRLDSRPISDSSELAWCLEGLETETCTLSVSRKDQPLELAIPVELARVISYRDQFPERPREATAESSPAP